MRKSAPPKFEQIARGLGESIRRGRLQGKVPSVNELVAEYGIAKATAARVLAWLKEAGFIETVVGSGSFVRRARGEVTLRIGSDHDRWRRILPRLEAALAGKLAGVRVVFDLEGTVPNPDLLNQTSLCPFGYQIFRPYSPGLVKRLRQLDLTGHFPGLHEQDGHVYGFPFLASPTFLGWNRLTLKKAGLAEPKNTESTVSILEDWADRGRGAPFDMGLSSLKDAALFILEGVGTPSRARPIAYPEGAILNGLRRYEAFCRRVPPGASMPGGTAFGTLLSLMADAPWFLESPGYEPGFLPLRIGRSPCNFLHSQSLMLSGRGEKVEVAESVIEAFFSVDVQRVFAEAGYGLPMNADAPSRHPLAALARRELPRSRWDYGFPAPPLMAVMHQLLYIHGKGQISGESLVQLTEGLLTAEAQGLQDRNGGFWRAP